MGGSGKLKSKVYLNVLTIIFAIAMIAGYEQVLEGTSKSIKNMATFPALIQNWRIFLPLLMCSLILLRFFFAPVCNVKAVLEKSSIQDQNSKTIWKPWPPRAIMLVDISVLLAHAVIYFFMCQSAREKLLAINKSIPNIALSDGQFYFFCKLLLILNAIWLMTVRARTRKKFWTLDLKSTPHVFWAINNLLAFLFLICWPHLSCFFVLLNCFIDFFFTPEAYFRISYDLCSLRQARTT